jgi:D-glycero-D-manno-heptose 1,7-bisphosphate phosphatase
VETAETKNKGRKRFAVFMDRDGTINEEVGYLSKPEQLRLYPEAVEAIGILNRAGIPVVVITNQSGIARGYFDEAFVNGLHARINEILGASGARIDRFYFCPHHPTEGIGPYLKTCTCRKPEPGMLLAAARELGLDLPRSYMIGDMPKDIEAAVNAGAKGILVRTGYGKKAADSTGAAYVADHVLEAVRWILKDRES